MEEYNEYLKMKRHQRIQRLKEEINEGDIREISPTNFSDGLHFKYINDVTKTNENAGFNDLFEVYNLKNDLTTVYIASKNNVTYSLDIFEMKSIKTPIKKILALKQHLDFITLLRYFKDPYTGKDYLISADKNLQVIVWNIVKGNQYDVINKIDSNYEIKKNLIYSCLLLFTKVKKYLMITKFCLGKVYSRLIDFESGAIFRNMKITRENKTRYILQWVNKSDENVYLIECCANSRVLIYDPISQEIYDEVKLLGDNNSGCIIQGNNKNPNAMSKIEYLCVNNVRDNDTTMYFYDLHTKEINFSIKLDTVVYQIYPWNDQFLIYSDKNNKAFGVINLKNNKVFSIYKGFHGNKPIKCVKKVKLNNHELLLTYGGDYTIKVWVNTIGKIKYDI